jgi:protein-S-isoprenylcysteine O-methyltransferase Ste14
VIFAAVFLLGCLLQRLVPTPTLVRTLRHALALPCLVSSAALAAWGFSWFLRLRTSPIPQRPSAALITSGPYWFSRNPLYVSAALLYAGVALWLDVLWALLLLPLAVTLVRLLVIAEEERYLERRFGPQYLDYKARVRRWL